jgi:hypothetical protein
MVRLARLALAVVLVVAPASPAHAGLISAVTTTLTDDPLALPYSFTRVGDVLLIGGSLGDPDGFPDRAAIWSYNLTTGATTQSLYWNGAIRSIAAGPDGNGYVGGDFLRPDGYTNGVIAPLSIPNNTTTLVTSVGGAGVVTHAVTADGQAVVFNGYGIRTLYRAADGTMQYLTNFHGTTHDVGGFSISGGNIYGAAETALGVPAKAAQWSLSTLAISHPAISGVPGNVDYLDVGGVSGSLMFGAFGTTADDWLHPWYSLDGVFHEVTGPATGLLVRGVFYTGAMAPSGDVLLGGAFFTGTVPNGLPSGGLLYSPQFNTLDPGLIFSRLGDTNMHALNSVNAIGYFDDTGFLVLGQGSVDITRVGVTSVPEPSSIVLCLSGLLTGLVLLRTRRSGKAAA